MEITTKYNFGDVVYAPRVEYAATWVPCVDCDGVGSLAVEGKDFRLDCPTCCPEYIGGRPGFVHKREWKGWTETLTIAQIRFDINPPGSTREDERRYMCYETGVGSGTLWDEHRLFVTREEAQEAADAQAVAQEANIAAQNAQEAARRSKRPRKAKVQP